MAEQTLVHYSKHPLTEIRSVSVAEQGDHHKPKGLWVSVLGECDWKSWCEGEGFSLPNLSIAHRIILSDKADILRLSNAQDIDQFTLEFARPERYGSRYEIDWQRVANGRDGIIIAPYVWERRLNGGADWYYRWDCASGCIWNASAVKQIIPMQSEAAICAH